MTKEEFQTILPSIPTQPGVYRYYNDDNIIIYVGKAKNLKKRVTSYFSKISDSFKTRKLVSEIVRMEFALVDTEQDALLLENSLIKQYQPKYNFVLKDDRSYPHIVIKNEPFPRIFLTRRVIKDGSEYLGPYTSVDQVRDMLALIKQLMPIRSCNLNLTEKSIAAGKFKACLEYHIGNCKAPCIGMQSLDEYCWYVNQIREVFRGKTQEIAKRYKLEMKAYAENMEFEKAEIIKQKLNYLKNYQSQSIIVNTKIDNIDVCSIQSVEEYACLNYMIMIQGSIRQTHSFRIDKKLDETDEEILTQSLMQLRDRFQSSSKEIIVPISITLDASTIITIPKSGDKKRLLELSLQNVDYYMREQKRKLALNLHEKSEADYRELLENVQTDLRLTQLPIHIECFDNSNFQGAYPVSAMVCFLDGKPSNKNYRHYHIKTVEGINDFASMKETVYRRFKRLLDENKSLPQLVIIDGGKGQLSAAMESIIALKLHGKISVVGLAKNVEEIFFPGDSESLKLPYQSETLNLLKYIRDEVHRFGITFHRKIRSKGIVKNELENIKGIGESKAQQLLTHFRSVKKVKQASLIDLESVIGKAAAQLVWQHYQDLG
jgi:excinuclease ABC subunit C